MSKILIDKITSSKNEAIISISKLKNKKVMIERKQFLAEGINIIQRAKEKNLILKSFILDSSNFESYSFPFSTIITDNVMKKLSSLEKNIGIISLLDFPSNFYIINNKQDIPKVKKYDKVIVLDNINNPGNLGTIIRSAVAFNMEAIFIINQSVFPLNQKTLSATQGAIFDIDIYYFELFPNDLLTNFQLNFFYLDNSASTIHELKTNFPKQAYVFGNESNGIDLNQYSSLKYQKVFIPIDSKIESLSVSTAASIVFFYLDQIIKK